MHYFTEYIQPLTFWLYAHPHWALFITFLISFSESLAIIGSIIPGSVTMTAIGILAGSGAMRIDLTYLAATLGAIAGDGGSYALGITFSDRLPKIWPFSHYPKWLNYGKAYFARHGSTSVLIGRFVGPMRSIIPVIAGMMHMNRWHFLFANTLSAVGWAILYVTPGVLIGAASTELSSESATRLFILIIILLVVIWLSSLAIKWLLIHANQFLHLHLHNFWTWLKRHHHLVYIAKCLAPKEEKDHYTTAALTASVILCFFIMIITTALVLQGTWVATINTSVYLFFQSLHTQPFDTFFIAVSLVISPLPLATLILSITMYTLYYRDWRALRYWLSLSLSSGVVIFLFTQLINIPRPNGLSTYHATPLFPDIDLTLATSLFGFLIFYISTHYRTNIMLSLRVIMLIILLLAGIAPIYLGDNWVTSIVASYFIGLTICLLHWVFYRRRGQLHQRSELPIIICCLLLVLATSVSCFLYFKKLAHVHSQQIAQYVITDQVWWNQQQPLLPIYSTNRIGNRTGLLNIQYVGSIRKLQKSLETAGWKQQPDSFFYSLLMRAGGSNSAEELPLMAELYQYRKPTLVMTYNPGGSQSFLILRFWRSNYHLQHYQQPIWLGSVDNLPHSMHIKFTNNAPNYIRQSLHGFKFNQITLPDRYLQSLAHPTSSVLLMIKEPD